ncbi:hypothetical protein ES703_111275 [subsurface metagenome]
MPGRGNRGLHHQNIRPGFSGDRSKALGISGGYRDRASSPLPFNRLNSFTNKIIFNRCGVNFLQQGGDFSLRCFRDFGQYLVGIIVPCLNPFQVENGESTHFAHQDGEVDIGHRIHRRGNNGNGKNKVTYLEINVGLVGINRYISGHYRYFVKAISAPQLFELEISHFILHPFE